MEVDNWKGWSFKLVLLEVMQKYPRAAGELFSFIVLDIWKARNKWIFEKVESDEQEILSGAQRKWLEYMNSKKENQCTEKRSRINKWVPPNKNCNKLNCDVVVLSNQTIAAGFVVRDCEGKVVLAGNKKINASGDSTMLEGMAMRESLKTVKQHNVKIEEVEGGQHKPHKNDKT